MDVLPTRSLVGYIAENTHQASPTIVDKVTKDVVLGHGNASHARANSPEKRIESPITERFINQSGPRSTWKINAYTREPLPIAVMSENGSHGLAFAKTSHYVRRVADGKASAQFFVADGEQFNSLEEVIAEPMIEFSLDVSYLFGRLFGESAGEIGSHYVPAIPQNSVYNKVFKIGNNIKQTQW